MTTFTAYTILTSLAQANGLAAALEDIDDAPYGVGVFEIEDGSSTWEVGSYFTEAPDEVALALLAAAFGANPFVISELPDTDWVAKVRRELSPVRAGRFFVYGNHDADKVTDDVVPLLIEAAMAFGTGHHGTTLGCLKALDRLMDNGETPLNVADIGCGTAVLAMAAAHVLPNPAIATDIDPTAVEVALANVKANNLEGRVSCVEATGFDHPELAARAPFDLIFANILMGPLIAMSPDLVGHLSDGGHAILSGILNEQADEVAATYAANGASVAHREEIGEWTTLTLRKTP